MPRVEDEIGGDQGPVVHRLVALAAPGQLGGQNSARVDVASAAMGAADQ